MSKVQPVGTFHMAAAMVPDRVEYGPPMSGLRYWVERRRIFAFKNVSRGLQFVEGELKQETCKKGMFLLETLPALYSSSSHLTVTKYQKALLTVRMIGPL